MKHRKNNQITNFSDYTKKARQELFPSAFELAYRSFIDLGFDKKDKEFFMKNASECVEALRTQCWEEFLIAEIEFTKNVILEIAKTIDYQNTSGVDSVELFLDENIENIYSLCLSNTQSRRSRAGKEFESIIELLLMGLELPFDAQGKLGVALFASKGLGKMLDEVVPGVIQYEIDKRRTILISAKTTLRERWQEVKEEMDRTGAKEMYLATIDEKVSTQVLTQLKTENIVLTTTKAIKKEKYPNETIVISFEELFENCLTNEEYWNKYPFVDETKHELINKYEAQINKYGNKYPYYLAYLEKMIAKLS